MMMLHERKIPFCEFCQRGRMLKRYCKRVRVEDEEEEKFIHRATAFGDIIEVDHLFPLHEARGLSDEQSALALRRMLFGLLIRRSRILASQCSLRERDSDVERICKTIA